MSHPACRRPCRACDRLRGLDDDGHCSECRRAERQLVTDGGQVDSTRPAFIDPLTEWVECHFCGRVLEPTECDGFDLSTEDEYYPRMVPVCPEHDGGCR